MSQMNLQEMYRQHEKDTPQLLPEGEYELEVIGSSVKETTNATNIYPVFRVVSGPYAGQKCFAGNFSFSQAAAGIFFQNMKGFGLGKDYFESRTGEVKTILEGVAGDLKGRIAKIYLVIEPYQGEDRNKIPIGKIKLQAYRDGGGQVQPAQAQTTATPAVPPQGPKQTPVPPPAPQATAPAAPPDPKYGTGTIGPAAPSPAPVADPSPQTAAPPAAPAAPVAPPPVQAQPETPPLAGPPAQVLAEVAQPQTAPPQTPEGPAPAPPPAPSAEQPVTPPGDAPF